jgi:hypothetical protein
MALINWIFVVDLDEFFHFVIYFLIKSHCDLVCVNLLHIAGFRALATPDVQPIFSSSSIENVPIEEWCPGLRVLQLGEILRCPQDDNAIRMAGMTG